MFIKNNKYNQRVLKAQLVNNYKALDDDLQNPNDKRER